MNYEYIMIPLIILGVIPGVTYIIWHGVPWTTDIRSWNSIGWILAIMLLYLFTLYRFLFLEHESREWTTFRIVSIFLGIGLDVVLWLRLYHWRKYVREFR